MEAYFVMYVVIYNILGKSTIVNLRTFELKVVNDSELDNYDIVDWRIDSFYRDDSDAFLNVKCNTLYLWIHGSLYAVSNIKEVEYAYFDSNVLYIKVKNLSSDSVNIRVRPDGKIHYCRRKDIKKYGSVTRDFVKKTIILSMV